MMDHTLGQRQFTDLVKVEMYIHGKRGLGDAGFQIYIGFLLDVLQRVGGQHAAATVVAAHRLGAVLASNDVTPSAVHTCHAAGIATIVGPPNLVHSSSHSGNVAAQELAQLDRLDILSSDYVPAGLLMAAGRLCEVWGDLQRGLRTVTAHPANALGMSDRGRLASGLRADLIRYAVHDGTSILRETWCADTRVA